MPNRRRNRLLAAAGIGLALLVPGVIGAVYISPTALFLSDVNRNTQLTIGNSSDYPEEVSIELKFGFVDTDSAGRPFIRLIDVPGSEYPSAADWIGVYPMRTRLAPGERQVVRVFARPPADLPDGEYWSRLIVTGRRATTTVAGSDTLIRAGLSLMVQLVSSVTFRKGALTTGLTLDEIQVVGYRDSLVLLTDMNRQGNAAYLGTVFFELQDRSGAVVDEWERPVSVHFSVRRRFELPTLPLEPGDYVLRIRAEPTRPDISDELTLPARAVTYSVPVTVE